MGDKEKLSGDTHEKMGTGNIQARKKLIKQLKSRLVIERKRRNAIIKQVRSDIFQLLQIGHHDVAFARVGQLYREQSRLSVYHQLDNFCDCISMNLRDISRHSKLPDKVQEAMSSIIFAASRCGELPELHSLRNMFKELFGQEFDRLNVELLPGNAVNSQTKQYLTATKLKEDVKLQIMDEIAKESCNIAEDFSSYKTSPSTTDSSWVETLNNTKIYTSKRTRSDQRCKATIEKNENFDCKSCEAEEQSPRVSHVHPKLPDYDNLVARFRDLKGEYMYKNTNHRSFSKWIRW
nr:uncharacterized protein LOC104089364 [Nicotiana tomentosiformis]